jgi:hypothetical protein
MGCFGGDAKIVLGFGKKRKAYRRVRPDFEAKRPKRDF